jgi:signal transduction histidine kinase
VPPATAPAARRVRFFRLAFVLFGWALAVAGAAAFDATRLATYVAFGVLMVVVRLFWIEGRFDFPFPYLANSIAFIYIIGLPVIPLDYLAGIPTFVVQVVLTARGWLRRSPAPQILRAARRNPSELWWTWIDTSAGYTIAVVALGFRYAVFHLLRRHLPSFEPMVLIVATELLAPAFTGLITFTLPLPPGDLFTAQPPWRMALEDERADVTYATTLLLPLLVFLICFGYETHGIVGAFAWSLCTLGPHYLLRLLHDRRTSLVQRHEMLRTLHAELERRQEEQKDFVYTVTHDLKEPVNAILLTADIALDRHGGEMTAEAREDFERIVRLAAGTEDMIRDLMDLFQIVSAPEPLATVKLQDVVAHALEVLQPQLDAKRVHVEVAPLPTLVAQPRKLAHVVANLLSNAVKYVPASNGRISVTGECRGGDVVFGVHDNGIGIAPDYHHTIFNLFTRVPVEGQTVDGAAVPGSGVGLAIVKQVVAAHRGTVWVESRLGEGSHFYVRLPSATGIG